MKRSFTVALFSLAFCFASFAQVPVTVTSNTDPATIANYISTAESWVQTVQNGVSQLQTATQALQYQIMAVQQLSQGSWDSFVRAWNDETVALNNYTQLVNNMPSLSQIQAVQQLVNSEGYQDYKQSLSQLDTQWGYASNIVHTTDSLIQNTKQRQQLWGEIQSQSSTTGNDDVAQLQIMNQALGLLGGELRDVNVNMGSWKDYYVAQAEQAKLQQQILNNSDDAYHTGDGFSNVGAPDSNTADDVNSLQ